jgi:hypothetical protein
VLVEQRQVLVDQALGHAGEQGQLLESELGGQQPQPLKAPEVAVDRLLGVMGTSGDVGCTAG